MYITQMLFFKKVFWLQKFKCVFEADERYCIRTKILKFGKSFGSKINELKFFKFDYLICK